MEGANLNKEFEDKCKCKANKEIMAQLDTGKGEQVVFSTIVIKFNRFGMKQERCMLLTNMYLYNINKDSVQRRIGVEAIKAMTKCVKEKSMEFVIHVKKEYDYQFDSEYRDQIFEAIKFVYWKHNKTNIPVYAVDKNLKEFHTSKRDIMNGMEIEPPQKYIVKAENTYPETPGSGAGQTASA